METIIVVYQTHDQCRPCLQYFILETTDQGYDEDTTENQGTTIVMDENINQIHVQVDDPTSTNEQESINLTLHAYNKDN